MTAVHRDLGDENDTPRSLTRAEAGDAGLIPHGHGWDEDRQLAVPIGTLVLADRIERGVDLSESLARMQKTHDLIRRMIADGMEEAEYKPDGYPLTGKMHDFYRLPNYDKKVLTKQGGEKLALFARLRRSRVQSTERQCTKEFSMAVVQVELVDHFGQPAGSGEAACTTAEVGFAKASKKYQGDYRAALNDVIARAGKRAFVQAVVYATATDEIFDTSGVPEKQAEASGAIEESVRLPQGCGSLSGKLLSECDAPSLAKLTVWLRSKKKPTYDAIADAIDQELDLRRDNGDVEEFPG